MSTRIISKDSQDPIVRAMVNLTEAGLDPTPVAEWWPSDQEAA